MELSLLKAVLDQLDMELKIESMSDRKLMQKAIYLTQRSGADLGYRFGWYKKGPYCSALADVYYRLDKNPNPTPQLRLSKSSNDLLKSVKDLLTVPEGVDLAQPEWAELVASVDYLKKISGLKETDASETLLAQKPHLASYENQAKTALKRSGLWSE
ncbi:MAG: hypothetical protein KF824_09215 [Fimbriimonadaceae bacterium]|nr:MAG: hypothetical protein KF824_09215 [Fimbriimonadaceae bacterium]